MHDAPQKSPTGHDDGDPGTPPVTICCASPDEAAVREAAQALTDRGYRVELAIGIDGRVEVLTDAIANMKGRGLYVLCRSHSLDRSAIDQMREILRDHEVPFGRTLTLAVNSQRPRDLEERIVSVLRRMVTGRADGRPKAWGSSLPPREEGPDTTVRRLGAQGRKEDPAVLLEGLGTPPENADPDASTSLIEVQALRDRDPLLPAYTGADHTVIAPAPTAPEAPATAETPSVEASAPISVAESVPVPAAVTVLPPSPEPPLQAPTPSQVSPAPSLEPKAEGSSAPAVFPADPSTPSPMTSTVSSPVSTDDDDFDPPLTFGGRMGRILGSPTGLAAVLGGLAVVVLLVVIVSWLGGDDEDDTQASNESTPTDDEPDDQPKASPEQEMPEQEMPEQETPEQETPEQEMPEQEPESPEEEPGSVEPPPPASRRASSVPAVAALIPGDPPPPLPSRDFSASDDPPEVVEALRFREVRALDLFIVAPERPGTLGYERAIDYCKELEIAELRGWRVPSIGELNAVGKANMLGRAVYWSATPGDTFGDLMLVLNTKKDRISIVTRGWDGAKIVCVRLRQP